MNMNSIVGYLCLLGGDLLPSVGIALRLKIAATDLDFIDGHCFKAAFTLG